MKPCNKVTTFHGEVFLKNLNDDDVSFMKGYYKKSGINNLESSAFDDVETHLARVCGL